MKGRLVELPCAVGDKIYYIDQHTKKIDEDTVKYFTITKDGCRAILERHNIKFWDFYEWGKTVFVKKEDAENALDHPTEKGGVEE